MKTGYRKFISHMVCIGKIFTIIPQSWCTAPLAMEAVAKWNWWMCVVNFFIHICGTFFKPPSQLLLTENPSNHHGPALPPLPPSHRQQPSVTALNQVLSSTHHAGQSLNSSRQLTASTGSPAPVAGQSPAELQTTSPESVPLQDSWVLGSNVPLETR